MTSATAFNRTIVELKHVLDGEIVIACRAFNRTIVELKLSQRRLCAKS